MDCAIVKVEKSMKLTKNSTTSQRNIQKCNYYTGRMVRYLELMVENQIDM